MTDDRTHTFDAGPAPDDPVTLRLLVVDDTASWLVPLDVGDRVAGRGEESDIRIDDPSVSRAHVRIRVGDGNQVTVIDLQSRNGTTLNGDRLEGERPFRPGDVVHLGRAALYLHVGDPAHWQRAIDDAAVQRARRRRPRDEANVAKALSPRTLDLGEAKMLVADPEMSEACALLEQLASSPISVLVTGETGVGKELAALLLHRRSGRSGRFVGVNCAAIAEGLAESELFGHARGAFTGAQQSRVGLVEAADGGTLFLDEVAELSPTLQAKLLRVLETRTVVRLGEVEPRPVDVRVVGATHRDLEAEVEQGKFRRDLLYRLAGAQVLLPPLRRRVGEILPLAQSFLARAAQGRPLKLDADVEEMLVAYTWPGNVRELRHAIEYAAATCSGTVVTPAHLPTRIREPPAPRASSSPSIPSASSASSSFRAIADEVRDLEKRRIEEALEAADGNKTKAASLIGMPIRTFSEKIKHYGIRRGE